MNLKPSILIAWSSEALSKDLADALAGSGLTSCVVSTGRDCIENVKEGFFQVVLVDVSLPDNHGIEILKQIKNHSSNTEVIMTAEIDSPDIAVEALGEGAFAYLKKPLNVEHLVLIVLKALERRQLKLRDERRFNQLSYFLNMTEDINPQFNIEQSIRQLVKRAVDLTESECGSIALLEDDNIVIRELWDGKEWHDLTGSEDTQTEIPQEGCNEKNVYLDEWLGEKKMGVSFMPLPCLRSYICVPIVDKKGEFLGVIEVCNKDDVSRSEDVQILEGLAKNIAIVIENFRLYEDARISAEQLKESETKYRVLVENSPDLIFIVEGNRFKYINGKASETMFYSPEELYGFNVFDLIPSNYRDVFTYNLRKVLRGEDAANYELTLIKKDNSEVVLDVSSVLNEYDAKPAVQIIGRDITDRRKTDEEILRLAAAVKSLNSAVTITDMNKNIVYINPIHKKVFGYELAELIGKQSSILYPFDDPTGISKKIYDAILIVGWEGERLGMRKNGEVFPVYEKTSIVKDKIGRQIGIVSVIEDITLRKRLEQALRESEERYRTLVETAKSAIIATDDEGKIALFNPAAEYLFGYSMGEIKGRELTVLMPERYREAYKVSLETYVETGISSFLGKTVEFLGLKKNREEFPIEVSLSACKIGGHNIFTAIIFDITERKNLHEQLIQSEKMVAVGQLISGVAHEVNNPLTVVMGYTEMLLGEPNLDKSAQKALQAIYNAANRSRKVIQNLLSFARKHSPEREYTCINEVLDRTLGLKEYDLRKNNIEIVKKLEPDLPRTMVDPNQLQQVFLNLIINAEQAVVENEDERRLVIESRVKNGENRINFNGVSIIEISFSDNGPGISNKNLKKIFDPFFTTKPVGKGTGLGLSVSYGIIKEHGGEIFALSEESKGAVFIIELPLLKEIS